MVCCYLFALAYLPRRMQWQRYLFPGILPKRSYTLKANEKGFTLIELLIAVAMIGIFCGGLFAAWVQWIHTQKDLYERVQIQAIATSEMNALMAASTLASPSPDSHSLPIPLSDFQNDLKLKGEFTVVESETPGLVKISVTLTQDTNQPTHRHYRLIGYRTTGPRR